MRATIKTDGTTLLISDRDGEIALVMSRHGPRVSLEMKSAGLAEAIAALINTPTKAAAFLEFAKNEGSYNHWKATQGLPATPPTAATDDEIPTPYEIWMQHHKGKMSTSLAIALLRVDPAMSFNDADEYLHGKEPRKKDFATSRAEGMERTIADHDEFARASDEGRLQAAVVQTVFAATIEHAPNDSSDTTYEDKMTAVHQTSHRPSIDPGRGDRMVDGVEYTDPEAADRARKARDAFDGAF